MPSREGPTSLLVAVALLASLLASVLVGTPAHAAGPIRILIAGDSITQGFHGDYTWRYRLAKEFARQQVPVDFVGSRRDVYQTAGWARSDYADPNFDRDHFAWAGIPLGLMSSWITNEVREQRPDLLVLAAGVNDLRTGATAQETNANLRNAITNARSAKRDIRIIVSPILDARDPNRPSLATQITTYDDLARGTVASMSTSESPVTMAETTDGWQRSAFTVEDIHPNPTGEAHIAQRIGEALYRARVLPAQPDIFRVLPWTRMSTVKAVRSGQRLALSWSWQGSTGSRVMTTRVGASGVHYNWVHGGSLTTASFAEGATYAFRVQLFRGRMTGPYGPTTRVTMPGQAQPLPVARVVVDRTGIHWTRSTTATSYLVMYRRGHAKRWMTSRTTGLYLLTSKVKQARVWAVNSAGLSAVRAGRR